MGKPQSLNKPMDLSLGLSMYDAQRASIFTWTPQHSTHRTGSAKALGRVPPIVVFNGPPLSGKDTLCMELGKPSYSFKGALYEATAQFYGIELWRLIRLCSDRATKDTPSPLCGWNSWTDRYNTPREALQIVSELVCKPMFGKGVFGRAVAFDIIQDMASGDIPEGEPYITISDGGFLEEGDALCQTLKDAGGLVNMLKLEIHVDGLDFTGDTRSYWPAQDANNLILKAEYHRDSSTPVVDSVDACDEIIVEFLWAIPLWRD